MLTNELMPIAAVERETGLAKDVLRAWERRYGFPRPLRADRGDRLYPADQVDKLRTLRRLIDIGHRPKDVVPLSAERLRDLYDETHVVADLDPDVARLYDLLAEHRLDALRAGLASAIMRRGLEGFVVDIAAPLVALVGDGWARGSLRAFQEHVFTEKLLRAIRVATHALLLAQDAAAPARARPLVLLTTVPGELHSLGLAMAEAVLVTHGARCLVLGSQTPLTEIAGAAQIYRADIVALSFSTSFPTNQASAAIGELRALVPDWVDLWIGGSSPALRRAMPRGVWAIERLGAIPALLGEWRRQSGDGPATESPREEA
jgi:DNA-binding transcriptional MerR regulator/methylmalonyl-CoA mutase cobalamin-binding subunit